MPYFQWYLVALAIIKKKNKKIKYINYKIKNKKQKNVRELIKYIEVEKISYKHPQSLEKCIDL